MFRQRHGDGRGCCIIIPIGCLAAVLLIVLLPRLASHQAALTRAAPRALAALCESFPSSSCHFFSQRTLKP
jgi:hypothetical protein